MKTLFVFSKQGKMVAMLKVNGDKVDIVSEDPKVSVLNGSAMKLRVSIGEGDVIADASRTVIYGEQGYLNAVIDTLQTEGFELTG